MVRQGEIVSLAIEKPASGGRMIARAGGQVVLVSGVIPGERARVRIERVGKGVAFGRAAAIEEASPDRREPVCDLECGGALYGHIAYARQLAIKGEVIADALKRIAKLPWAAAVDVAASPETGHRMRARLHLRGDRLGFFREGTHEICDAASTRQLSPEAVEALASLGSALAQRAIRRGEIELSENVAGSERAVHIDTDEPGAVAALTGIACEGVTGLSSRVTAEHGLERMHAGTPYVHETLMTGETRLTWRRHVGAFFQGNRYLLNTLVQSVIDAVPADHPVIDLYAGVGLFSIAVAASRGVKVVAVEGDPLGASDLVANAVANPGQVEAVQESVESFVTRRPFGPATLIVDPPRTGMSVQALQGVIRWAPPRIVYVSCDTATFARDTRALMDAGYELCALRAFDLFPNTPHVETLATFARG